MSPIVYLILSLFALRGIEKQGDVPRWLSMGSRIIIFTLVVILTIQAGTQVRA